MFVIYFAVVVTKNYHLVDAEAGKVISIAYINPPKGRDIQLHDRGKMLMSHHFF